VLLLILYFDLMVFILRLLLNYVVLLGRLHFLFHHLDLLLP
jgi:hypothetical protein